MKKTRTQKSKGVLDFPYAQKSRFREFWFGFFGKLKDFLNRQKFLKFKYCI